jgi:hypothetical protein
MIAKTIKTFDLEGEFADDSFALLTRLNAEKSLGHMMRDNGYLPVLDLDPIWSTSYDSGNDKWHFAIYMYGTYVGKRRSWEYEGVSQNKLIPRITRQSTSDL